MADLTDVSAVEIELPERPALPAQPDPMLDRIAEVVRTVIGVPVALVSLIHRDGQILPGAAGLAEEWNDRRATPLSHAFSQHVVRTNTPLVITDIREHPVLRHNAAIRDLQVVAYAGTPLLDLDGRPIGSLCAIDNQPRRWTVAELALLDDLATACSTELQLRTSVERSTAAYRRTRALLDLSEALSATITVEEVAAIVARVAGDLLGAAFGGVTELDDAGRALRYIQHSGVGSEILDPDYTSSMPLDSDTPSSRVIRSHAPLVLDLAELEILSPEAARLGRHAGGRTYAYFPLTSRGRVLGTLTLMWVEPRELSHDDRETLLGLARYAAQAIDRARLLAQQHAVASTMQSALLPALPAVPWLELAGRYLPAYHGNDVGGDWYDAHLPDPETLVVTVGDVAGHDTSAAAAMGQLRAASRAIMVEAGADTTALLTRLEVVMDSMAFERIVTAVAMAVTRSPAGDGWTIGWSNAGHPPPLLIEPGAAPVFVEDPVDPLLGCGSRPVRRGASREVPAGSTIVLFTDGLIERRGQHLQDGMSWLAELVGKHADQPLGDLVDELIQAPTRTEQFDDTVVLGLRLPA